MLCVQIMSTDSIVNTTMSFTATTVPDVTDFHNDVTKFNLPFPKPTVSLDARPIVIPIVSCVICFPLLAFAIICALRRRAQRHRRREHMRRLKVGVRAVTLEIPGFRERPSFFSRDSSSDVSPKTGDKAEIEPELPSGMMYSRRASKGIQHQVKFLTTSAVLHVPRRPSHNGRLRQGSKVEVTFRDEPSFIENSIDLSEELRDMTHR